MLQADGCRGVVIDRGRRRRIGYHIRVDSTSLGRKGGGGIRGDWVQGRGRSAEGREAEINPTWSNRRCVVEWQEALGRQRVVRGLGWRFRGCCVSGSQ